MYSTPLPHSPPLTPPVNGLSLPPIYKLDEGCTNVDDRMMLVQHRSGDRVMS